MLFKFVTSLTDGHCYGSSSTGSLKTQLRHCSCSYFERAEKSACVSGVNQCTTTKRRMLKIYNIYLCDDDWSNHKTCHSLMRLLNFVLVSFRRTNFAFVFISHSR